MNILKRISKTDWWVIAGFWVVAAPVIVFDYMGDMNTAKILPSTLLDLSLITLVSIAMVYWLAPQYLSKKKYAHFFILVLLVLVVQAFLFWLGYSLIWGWFSPSSILSFLGDEISNNSQSLGVLGGILLAKKYFEGQQDMLKLEAAKKSNELRALQSQVNPHFLFNNLNSLDELISSNPDEAKKYVNKLAHLYRHLINSKDNDVVTLEEELQFAKNYIYLLHQRYGESYKFIIEDTSHDKESILLPPASLQLVLENVVKHNVGSLSQPLETNILISQEKVIIRNRKKLKSTTRDKNGIGLKNLELRYELLSDKEIEVTNTDTYFEIVLPFIKLLNTQG